jgi:hypothetical protein
MTQLNTNPHHSPVLTVLQRVSTDRLQRAVNALADGSLSVTLIGRPKQKSGHR